MCHFFSSPIHAISCLFFCAVGWLGAAEQQPLGRACLRDFAEIYTLQTVGLKAEERLTRTYSLLAAKLNMSVEAVGVALEKETDSRLQDSTASKLNQARALFIRKSFAQAEQLAIASGDLAHRSTPRKTDELIVSLRLAAYSAMEQQKWEPAIKYLSVAVTEADSQKDLSVWAALQVGIAHAQKNLGLHDEHERTLWFIFHEYEQRLGIDSVETLHHQNELAVCLYERRKDAEAEKQIRLILASTLRVRGNDHADTQASRKNLARLLEAQGKFSEAEIMRRDVYDAHYRQLGGDALTTLKSREQLVLNLIGQKKFPEAEVESYALAKKAAEALGKDAPISLQGRAHELTASTSQKKFEPSLSLAEALVADSVRVLGADHSLTLQAKTNQGLCLNQHKRPGEALPILTEVLKTQQRTLAANDPSLLEVEHQISIAYLSQEKRKEALEHLRVALTGYEKAFGASDPRTQLVNQTANALVNTEEGKRILITERREALAKTAAKLGSSHPQALAEQFGVATFIAGLGLAQEALDEHSLVLAS
ncbi:MAG: tetratricopeptide repeat protein, partial [Verrucomicrobia bacterium]|nr:tetratricopeptide repeat protein [Verrucomicrobiota bacterium]